MFRPAPTRANWGRAFAKPDLMQIGRFAVAGAGRTAYSLGLYLLLLLFTPYWLAFTVSFAVTITVSAVINSRYVFFVGLTRRSYFLYVGMYLFNYLASATLLVLAVEL